MKDIILIGSGKAGLIHFKAYKKLGYENNIHFVDVNRNAKYFPDKHIYGSLKELFSEVKIDVKNAIADIAVPKEVFYDVISECESSGLKDMIIEKPFILKNDSDFANLNLVMVENYLYSKIFKYMKKYIADNKLTVKTIFSNFSKNRKSNSHDRRGMVNDVVNCYNIEMPHQVYMCQNLTTGEPNLLLKTARDMDFEDFSLKDHGQGLLLIENDGVVSHLYSNLMTDILEKNILVTTAEGYVIKGDFFTYTPDLKVITKGSVQIFKNDELILTEEYEEDDMITYMIQEFIEYFDAGKYDNRYRTSIIRFSNFYKKYNI